MAYVKRPTTQSAEFFRPDVYVNFRSTDSVNESTSEIKKGWVFVISKKNSETWEFESKEVTSLDFNSLMILDNEACKPFDDERKGLNLGEGAAFLLLFSEKVAEKFGYANENEVLMSDIL